MDNENFMVRHYYLSSEEWNVKTNVLADLHFFVSWVFVNWRIDKLYQIICSKEFWSCKEKHMKKNCNLAIFMGNERFNPIEFQLKRWIFKRRMDKYNYKVLRLTRPTFYHYSHCKMWWLYELQLFYDCRCIQ